MEEISSRHKKEQKDLQSRITQKKKSATKKTRKGINDECERLEQDLKARQAAEVAAAADGEAGEDAAGRSASAPADDAHDSSEDDDDLLASIVGSTLNNNIQNLDINGTQKSAEDTNVAQEGQRKPNRQKARLARRAAEQDAARNQAAEEAANMPDLKTQERNKMLEEAKKHCLVEKEVAANGHCLYLAMADQMVQQKLSLDPALDPSATSPHGEQTLKTVADYKKVRAAAADYIAAHPEDFEPFLEEPLSEYLHKIRDTGEWGGQLELTALARVYKLNINVLQATGRLEKIESGENSGDTPEAWLAYYRHGFGLGEHYNSLRKVQENASRD